MSISSIQGDLPTINFVKAVKWLKAESLIKFDKDIVEDLNWDKSNFSAVMALKKKLPLQKSIYFNNSYQFDNFSEFDFNPERDYKGIRNTKELTGFRIFYKGLGHILADIIEPDPIRERIKKVIKELQKKFQLKEIYARLGESGINASQIYAGMKDPKPFIESLKNIFNVNTDYILYDKQPIFLNGDIESIDAKSFDLKQEIFMVPLMAVKNRALYANSLDAKHFIDNLEKHLLLPNINRYGAEWLYFEVGNDEMEPEFKTKDWVLASKVHQEDWLQIQEFYVYALVTNEDILIKRLYVKDEQHFVLVSDQNKIYAQQLIAIEAIKELWFIRRHISRVKSKVFEKII